MRNRWGQSDPRYFYVSDTHRQICEALQKVFEGIIKRLMVFIHPRVGKSTLCTQLFPTWCLGRNPHLEIMQVGYAADIALEHSKLARHAFISPEYDELFPDVRYRPEKESQEFIPIVRQAAHEWGTIQGGRYRAAGIQGGITGRGADLLVIDDPVKNREDAESETIRQKIWDEYRGTLYTRLSPTGAIVLIMTRWNPDDLAGRLIAEMKDGGEQWEIINIPAIDDDGRAACPERWPIEKLKIIRKAVGEHEFEALYQQRPTLRGGNLFKADKIVWHDTLENFPDVRYVRFWDLASTEKERAKDDPDYTVGYLMGLVKRKDGLFECWTKHVAYIQAEAPQRNELIKQIAESDGPEVKIGIESVAGYKDTYTTMRDIFRGKRSIRKVTVSKDKVVRATPIEPIIEAGNFHILTGPWKTITETHFREFPNGAHDDIIDGASGAYGMLAKSFPKGFDRKKVGL